MTYGDYDTVNVAGSVRGPISDDVSYSFSAMSNEHDGYGENTRGEDADNKDMSAVRAHLNFEVFRCHECVGLSRLQQESIRRYLG